MPLPPPRIADHYGNGSIGLSHADKLLCARTGSQTKLKSGTRYKCPMCSYSSFIKALCEHHILRAHAPISEPVSDSVSLSPTSPSTNTLPPISGSSISPMLSPHITPRPSPILSPILSSPIAAIAPAPPPPPETQFVLETANWLQEPRKPTYPKLQVCEFGGCGYASNSTKFFQRHILYAHSKKRELKCTRCIFSTRDPIVYKSHLLEHLGL